MGRHFEACEARIRNDELFRSLHRRLLGRLLRRAEIMRGVDQRDVRQRLREIAGLAAGSRIVLLGQQAEIVGQTEEPLEQRTRASSTRPSRRHRIGLVVRQPVWTKS